MKVAGLSGTVAVISVFAAGCLWLQSDAGLMAASPAAYSEQQARQGQVVYQAKCQACHGENQEGGDEAPPLKGDTFWSEWANGTARALYSRILSTMPPDSAGSLAESEVIVIVECLMKANGLPPGGNTVRSADELNGIGLSKPRQ